MKSLIERVELLYGEINPDALMKLDKKKATREASQDKWLACVLMQGTYKVYKPVLDGIDYDFTLGDDRYPDTMEEALDMFME